MKNLIRNILKENDWDWAREIPSIEGDITITFCDMVLLDDNGKTITEVMKIVEDNFGRVVPPSFNSDRIADALISQEDGREVVLYIGPENERYGNSNICHVGWDTCETFRRNLGSMGKDIYTHQEFIKMFG